MRDTGRDVILFSASLDHGNSRNEVILWPTRRPLGPTANSAPALLGTWLQGCIITTAFRLGPACELAKWVGQTNGDGSKNLLAEWWSLTSC